jgi:hypothetical protein
MVNMFISEVNVVIQVLVMPASHYIIIIYYL